MFFDKKIVLFKQDVSNREEALKALAAEFVKHDLVTDDFDLAILRREEAYPTGLWLGKVGVAIPHADIEYIKEPQLGFMSFQKPVRFRDMVENDQEIEASLMIMLAVKKSEAQVDMLQKLMTIFQTESLLDSLLNAADADDVIHVFRQAGIE